MKIAVLIKWLITFNLRNFFKFPKKLRKKLRFFSKQKQKFSKYLIISEKKFSKKIYLYIKKYYFCSVNMSQPKGGRDKMPEKK